MRCIMRKIEAFNFWKESQKRFPTIYRNVLFVIVEDHVITQQLILLIILSKRPAEKEQTLLKELLTSSD